MERRLPLVYWRLAGRHAGRRKGREAGFSLMEVIVATVIATVAVLGLAYTFGTGRAYINRFERARAALAVAEGKLDALSVLSGGHPDLRLGDHVTDFALDGAVLGTLRWTISAYDDPSDGLGAADRQSLDLKRAEVTISWREGALGDSLRLERLLPVL